MEKLINNNTDTVMMKKLNGRKQVYTLGVNLSYDEMIDVMNKYTGENTENTVFVISGSNPEESAVGFVYYEEDGEKTFIGMLDNKKTNFPHPLEDIVGIDESQLWCVGIVEEKGNTDEYGMDKERPVYSLLRAFLVSYQTC